MLNYSANLTAVNKQSVFRQDSGLFTSERNLKPRAHKPTKQKVLTLEANVTPFVYKYEVGFAG